MKTITFFQHPTDKVYQSYQAYYVAGLREYPRTNPRNGLQFKIRNMQRFPLMPLWSERILNMVRRSRICRFSSLGGFIETWIGRLSHPYSPSNYYAQHVGQYVLSDSSHHSASEVGFLIDAHDGAEVRAPQLLEWGKLYYKSNYWPGKEYHSKVRPIVNGNPHVVGRIELLRELRSAEMERDLVFVSRIWGGREHTVRLFEALSRVHCKKHLYAILVQEKDKRYADRLDKVGVPWGFDLIPLMDLWRLCASSRLVMLRAGKHLCIPWRMIDLLAMGACPMLDHDPFPQWPTPLQKSINYLSVEIARPSDSSSGPVEDYEKVPNIVEAMLRNNELLDYVRHNNRYYFERYAAPRAVGEYIVHALIESEHVPAP
jgi:hypothetical protein